MDMYFARFAEKEDAFSTAAFQWPVTSGALLTSDWTQRLLAQSTVDFALRVSTGPKGARVLLLVSADAASGQDLKNCCEALARGDKPAGLVMPASAEEFDALTKVDLPWQMRVNYEGYYHCDEPLACDFRLYPVVTRDFKERAAVYQIHLRAHRPDAEMERRVRKYLAWLDIKNPFTEPVRAMQRLLVRRLLTNGWLGCEYLALEDRDSIESWREKIQVDFKQTTGRLGFAEAPLEFGDFSDWLATGRHVTREDGIGAVLPSQAATIFGEKESAMLLSSHLGTNAKAAPKGTASDRAPDVFISYAAGDFAYAASACNQLEENGVICWIAPRDIDRDLLPYTEAITRAMAQAKTVVVFVSDTANLSVHIPRELDMALERKLSIVPVRLQEVLPSGQLNYLLRTCQWLNAYGRDFRGAVDELLTRLRSRLG